MRSRKQPRDRVKNKARQNREQKSAAGSKHNHKEQAAMCCQSFREGPKTQASTPILFNIYVLREIYREGPKHKRIPLSCSTSTCCERFRERPKTQAFTPILFNIYLLRDFWRRPQKHKRVPRSCSTSMCCWGFIEGLNA